MLHPVNIVTLTSEKEGGLQGQRISKSEEHTKCKDPLLSGCYPDNGPGMDEQVHLHSDTEILCAS